MEGGQEALDGVRKSSSTQLPLWCLAAILLSTTTTIWTKLVMQFSPTEEPWTTFLWYRSASSMTSPGNTDGRRRRCHPLSTRRARLGSTNMIFYSPEKYFDQRNNTKKKILWEIFTMLLNREVMLIKYRNNYSWLYGK
jgi:hypothetical protein